MPEGRPQHFHQQGRSTAPTASHMQMFHPTFCKTRFST
jgi:hypothetical protein